MIKNFKLHSKEKNVTKFPAKRSKKTYFKHINENCTTDQQNGKVEGHKEQLVQQRMSAMLTTLFSARIELAILFKQRDYSALQRFGPVYSSVYITPGEWYASSEAVPDCSLAWPAVDCCQWRDWWTKKKFLGLQPRKWIPVWRFVLMSDVAHSLIC